MNESYDKAMQVAEQIVDDYGMPASREQLVARLAYAYAAGLRDGYEEAAGTATEAWSELTRDLLNAAERL